MTNKTARTPKLTILRLLAGGALLGISLAGLFGLNTSDLFTVISGATGAAVAAAALKMTHVF